jgi:hypothetical protein
MDGRRPTSPMSSTGWPGLSKARHPATSDGALGSDRRQPLPAPLSKGAASCDCSVRLLRAAIASLPASRAAHWRRTRRQSPAWCHRRRRGDARRRGAQRDAGFRGNELTRLWPDVGDVWQTQESSAGLFSHCFRAERDRGDLMRNQLRCRHHRAPVPPDRLRQRSAGTRRLVGGAGGKAGLSPPQGLRRMHGREQPAAARRPGDRRPAFEAAAGPELRQVALMCGEHTLVADLPAA